MPRNLGQTSMRKRRRVEDPMREFDGLPPSLRAWLTQAAMPWRPRSVLRAYNRALAERVDPKAALAELDRWSIHANWSAARREWLHRYLEPFVVLPDTVIVRKRWTTEGKLIDFGVLK